MTHENIFEKFMIEYDKANITSSYPSLTDYEIATILDKAYLALIAQKVTGTNFRKAPFEIDAKSIEDIQQLIKRSNLSHGNALATAKNEYVFKLPTDFLYFVNGEVKINKDCYNSSITTHNIAAGYKVTANNLPWINEPIVYMENKKVHVLIDAYKYPAPSVEYNMQYVKAPSKFVDDERHTVKPKNTVFELNDSMAEELINLAIIMSLEIVESTRLDNKIKTAPLES